MRNFLKKSIEVEKTMAEVRGAFRACKMVSKAHGTLSMGKSGVKNVRVIMGYEGI